MSHPPPQVIGVISDTHGLLRASAWRALQDCDHILHAGDVGDPDVLVQLRAIAPVTAVRGNCDRGAWAERLPWTTVACFPGLSVRLLHVPDQLERAASGVDMVVYGHTHQPDHERRDGVAFLNPGSAGPRRFALPICLARMTLREGQVDVQFVDLA